MVHYQNEKGEWVEATPIPYKPDIIGFIEFEVIGYLRCVLRKIFRRTE